MALTHHGSMLCGAVRYHGGTPAPAWRAQPTITSEIRVNGTSSRWPRVSVLVVNWNGLADTLEALASLSDLSYPNYDIVVVDNGSDGDDVDVLKRRFGNRIHLLENQDNYGFAEGNNMALSHALRQLEPQYIALLNNDAVVDRNWLTELMEPFLSDTAGKVAVTSPTIVDYFQRHRIRFGNDSRVSIFGQVRHTQSQGRRAEIRTITGASFVIRTSVLQQLEDFFCPEYFMYYEDVDLSWRLINLGYQLVHVPTSVVYHKESASTRSAAARARLRALGTRNKYLTFYRNLSFAKYAAILPVLVCYDVAVVIGVTLSRRELGFARSKITGIFESFRALGEVKHIGGGGFSYLDKRLYLDKLG